MDSLDGMRIGFVGLGLMGRPMCLNLHRAGATLTIHNRSRAVVDALVREGLSPAATPREVAESVDVVIVMVADTPAVEAVVLGKDGLAAGLHSGTVVIDMGTTAVAVTRALAARVRARGGDYLDAPVSGGEVGAREATLTIMVGGDEATLQRVRPMLEVLGRRITHIGDTGAGQVAKAANQVIVGLTIGAVAEALSLAARAGADPARVREALDGGFAASPILALHGQRMIDGTFAPGGKVFTQHKDLVQALELAESVGLELPATRLNRDLYQRLIDTGDGALDHSALYRLYADPS